MESKSPHLPSCLLQGGLGAGLGTPCVHLLEICLFQRKQPNKWPAWPACQSAAGKVEVSPRVSGAPSACGSGVNSRASQCGRERPGRRGRATRRVQSHSWPGGDRRHRPSPPHPLCRLSFPYCFHSPRPHHFHGVLTWRQWGRAQPKDPHWLLPASLLRTVAVGLVVFFALES